MLGDVIIIYCRLSSKEGIVKFILQNRSSETAENKFSVSQEFVQQCCLDAARKLINNGELEGNLLLWRAIIDDFSTFLV